MKSFKNGLAALLLLMHLITFSAAAAPAKVILFPALTVDPQYWSGNTKLVARLTIADFHLRLAEPAKISLGDGYIVQFAQDDMRGIARVDELLSRMARGGRIPFPNEMNFGSQTPEPGIYVKPAAYLRENPYRTKDSLCILDVGDDGAANAEVIRAGSSSEVFYTLDDVVNWAITDLAAAMMEIPKLMEVRRAKVEQQRVAAEAAAKAEAERAREEKIWSLRTALDQKVRSDYDLLRKVCEALAEPERVKSLLASWINANESEPLPESDLVREATPGDWYSTRDEIRFHFAYACAVTGETERGLRLLDYVVGRNPADQQLAWIAGNLCYSLGRFSDAVRFYEAALYPEADRAEWYSSMNLGRQILVHAWYDPRIRTLVADTEPENIPAGRLHLRLGELYLRAQAYDRTVAVIEAAVGSDPGTMHELNPTEVDLWLTVMEALRLKGDPRHTQIANILFSKAQARVGQNQGDTKPATKILTRLANDPYRFNTSLALAKGLASAGRYDEAVEAYQQARKSDPNNQEINEALLVIYRDKKGDLAAVDRLFTEALKVNQNSARNHMVRAVTRYRLKRWDEAIIDFTKVMALDPKRKQACEEWIQRAKVKRATAQQANQKLTIDIALRNPANYVGGVVSWSGEVALLEETKTHTLIYVDLGELGVRKYAILRATGRLHELVEGDFIEFVGKIAGPGQVHLKNGQVLTVPLVDNWGWFDRVSEPPSD